MNNFAKTCHELEIKLDRELNEKEIEFVIWLSECQREENTIRV